MDKPNGQKIGSEFKPKTESRPQVPETAGMAFSVDKPLIDSDNLSAALERSQLSDAAEISLLHNEIDKIYEGTQKDESLNKTEEEKENGEKLSNSDWRDISTEIESTEEENKETANQQKDNKGEKVKNEKRDLGQREREQELAKDRLIENFEKAMHEDFATASARNFEAVIAIMKNLVVQAVEKIAEDYVKGKTDEYPIQKNAYLRWDVSAISGGASNSNEIGQITIFFDDAPIELAGETVDMGDRNNISVETKEARV